MKPVYITVILAVLLSVNVFAQDMIIKKNSDLIKCKISEIGLDVIKYTLPEYTTFVIFAVNKDEVVKVIFENGTEMNFEKGKTNPANYLDNKKNIFKFEFMSPLTGNTTFAYERSMRPGLSLEATLGLIGLGIDVRGQNPAGAFGKFGLKFIKDPDFYLRGMKYAHILKGAYIKPEFAFGFYNHDHWKYYYDPNGYYPESSSMKRRTVYSGTLQMVLGKQWIINNAFAFDFYAGVGYGFSDYESSESYHYGYLIYDNSLPISFSAGIKIGLLFK